MKKKLKKRSLSSIDSSSGFTGASADSPTTELPRLKKRRRVSSEVAVTAPPNAEDETPKEAKDKRGVMHMASLPMHMSVEKLRHLMEQFGEVGRIYLAAEDKAEHTRRKKTGGNKKTRYTEGWVEFAKRRIARQVAESLNGTSVGGKKRHNFFRDDMWNMRYLPKFKWHQLKEGAIYNAQARKARLEQKISQARRENEFFLENRQTAKNRQHIAARRAAKGNVGAASGNDAKEARFPGFSMQQRPPPSRGGAMGDISDRILDSLF